MARPFTWTPERELALAWSAQGVSVPEQAQRLGVSVRMVEGWRRRRAFRARLGELTRTRTAVYADVWRETLRTEAERVRALMRTMEEARRRELTLDAADLLASERAARRAQWGFDF